jgi:hypothetical protein
VSALFASCRREAGPAALPALLRTRPVVLVGSVVCVMLVTGGGGAASAWADAPRPSTAASGSTPPPLPPMPGMPDLQAPSLGTPGQLAPQVAEWEQAFASQAQAALEGGAQQMGAGSLEDSFALTWTKAQAQAEAAGAPLPMGALPSASQLSSMAPGLSLADLPALPAMAPPSMVMPALPTNPIDPNAGWSAVFGAVPGLPSLNAPQMPSYASIEINPSYGDLPALPTLPPGCGESQGCSFLLPSSGLLGLLESQAGPSLSDNKALDTEMQTFLAGHRVFLNSVHPSEAKHGKGRRRR